ncbi:hypothetical protein DC522_14175 [Microvirga sp. KLBC 81]|uniref:hypothetical protein n=1 Tax=Microvirga sp. KLBC 81 TaxID=1862707 RepID=UPI000D507C26|nr:hypothetical protein [Microvirga sp. KLBC 81]PVE23745.1 hypothetical protein DC522_14175 [Microvirga sp. KLBC 81]
MACFPARALGITGFLLALLCLPAHADPFFVRVYGRTYKIDPRYPSDEQKGPKPQEAMEALPSDLAKGPGFRPSHEQVLAEVEERLWIAQNQLDHALGKETTSPERQNAGPDPKAVNQEFTESPATGATSSRSSKLQKVFDQRRALNILARELRRSMDLPVRTPETGFSRPKLSPEIEASYRALSFDPLEAYYGFRRVKAAFRSGDIELLALVAHYPLTVTGKAKRTIRTREQLRAAKDTAMDPRIRDIVAKSTFETVFVRDKGMMLGAGEVWITHNKTRFGLGAINLQ